MKKQASSRREFLKRTALGGIGLALGTELAQQVFDLWSAKAEHGRAVLNLHQMLTLAAMATQIIPADETPGAREAGVVDYIDTKIKDIESLRQVYQAGLQEVDDLSQRKFGKQFVVLELIQQKEVLQSMEKSPFFEQVWKDVIEAFAHSSVGKEVMGYPGGAQPHGHRDMTDQPQHSH